MSDKDDVIYEYLFNDKYHKNRQVFEIESFNLIFTKDKIILLMRTLYKLSGNTITEVSQARAKALI